jgi:hypothetical protein
MKILKLFSVFLLLTLLSFSCQQEDIVTSLTDTESVQLATNQVSDEATESLKPNNQLLLQSSPTYTGPSWIYFNKGNSSNNLYRTTSNDGITWGTTNPQIPNAQTPDGPGAAYFNNTVFAFFRGVSSNKIYYSYSSDGSTWSGGNTELGNGAETSDDPASIVFKGNLFLFYRGKGGIFPEGRIYYSQSGDGFNWTGNNEVNVTSGVSINTYTEPAVATDGTYLYLFIVYSYDTPPPPGGTLDKKIVVYRSFNGTDWTFLTDSGETTSVTGTPKRGIGVAAALYQSQLYLAFKAESNNNLLIKKYNISNGIWSSVQQVLSAKTNQRPSLATNGSRLVAVYKGNTSDYLRRSYTNDGTTWVGDNQIAGETNRGPSVIFTR